MSYAITITWLDGLPDNSIIEWNDYCTHAGISIYPGTDTRKRAGFVAERNSVRAQINVQTIKNPLHPYTIQPIEIQPVKPTDVLRRGLIKVSGIDQLEDRIEHYERRTTHTHTKHRATMKILRNDPTLPKSEVDRIDRLTYAADVVQNMFQKSLKIARNPLGKLTKLPKTSVERIADQARQQADDNKKNKV